LIAQPIERRRFVERTDGRDLSHRSAPSPARVSVTDRNDKAARKLRGKGDDDLGGEPKVGAQVLVFIGGKQPAFAPGAQPFR
jgi:hypothetical protein